MGELAKLVLAMCSTLSGLAVMTTPGRPGALKAVVCVGLATSTDHSIRRWPF